MKKLLFLLLTVFLFGCSESLKDTSPVSADYNDQLNLSKSSRTWSAHIEGELCYSPVLTTDINAPDPLFKGTGLSYPLGKINCEFSSCTGNEIRGIVEIVNKAGDKLFLEYTGTCSYTNLTRIFLVLNITGGTGEYKGAKGDATGTIIHMPLNGTRLCELDLKGNLYLERVNAY